VQATGPGGKLEYGDPQLANWMDCGVYNGWGNALNNGYEQIFIGTAAAPVPEPGSLALVALALTAVGFISRRRSSRKGPGKSSS